MIFTEEIIQHIKTDPVQGTILACRRVCDLLTLDSTDPWSPKDHLILQETYSLLTEVLELGLLPFHHDTIRLNGENFQGECKEIYEWMTELQTKCEVEESKQRISNFRAKFRTSLGSIFAYEFSTGDLDRVQRLINELRQHIAAAEGLEKEHQQRLLHRLERLQSELHKKVSDLDRFWGLIGDAGVVLGKVGKDAKPIVDRIREIADIVWQTQSRAEELPSGTKLPQLENASTKNSDEA